MGCASLLGSTCSVNSWLIVFGHKFFPLGYIICRIFGRVSWESWSTHSALWRWSSGWRDRDWGSKHRQGFQWIFFIWVLDVMGFSCCFFCCCNSTHSAKPFQKKSMSQGNRQIMCGGPFFVRWQGAKPVCVTPKWERSPPDVSLGPDIMVSVQILYIYLRLFTVSIWKGMKSKKVESRRMKAKTPRWRKHVNTIYACMSVGHPSDPLMLSQRYWSQKRRPL